MARLPNDHSDNETWGGLLNEFLSVSHNTDGTLKSSGSSSTGSLKTYYVHNGTDMTVGYDTDTWGTGTAGSSTAPQVSLNWVAPVGGAVLITLTGAITGGNAYKGQMSYSVRKSDGTSPLNDLTNNSTTHRGSTPAEGTYLIADPGSTFYGSISRVVTGLTAGFTYTSTIYMRQMGTAAQTTDPHFTWRAITVQQLLLG